MLEELDGLPGEGLVRRGLTDLAAGRLSAEALTLAIASFRLRRLGIELPPAASLPSDRELALYTALGTRAGQDAFARYNDLRRELDYFLEALESRRRRAGG